jgi:hypothetical protein
LGGIFALGTAYVLFADVRSLADITTDHVMTGLVLVGTIAAGHMFWPAARGGRLLAALGLAILFVSGTFICVTGSAGRSAEVSQRKEAEAKKVNGGREAAETDLKKAKTERDTLTTNAAQQCSSGPGPRCKGARALLEMADSHIAILEVRLDDMHPEQQVNGGLAHAAKVFALVVPAQPQQIEMALVLLWPFAKAMMLEVATIVFLGLGLGHKTVSSSSVAKPVTVATVSEPETEVDPVIAALRRVKRPVTNDELAAILGVTKGTASRKVAALNGVIRKDRVGREVAISLANRLN